MSADESHESSPHVRHKEQCVLRIHHEDGIWQAAYTLLANRTGNVVVVAPDGRRWGKPLAVASGESLLGMLRMDIDDLRSHDGEAPYFETLASPRSESSSG